MESKIMKNGKHLELVIAEPEIYRFKHEPLDFAILASDGVYDKLSNQQIVETVWETIEYYKNKYKKMMEKKRNRKRNTSIHKNMKSSLNSNKSARLTSQVRKIKQGKSYSQVFDDQKRSRQNSRSRLRSSSKTTLNSHKRKRSRSNARSNTSINLESGKEVEPWEEEMRKKYDEILGECVNNILKRSLLNQSEDNVTLIMLVFKDLINP
jgi:serine/threonine protein phosphatase PrpC